MTVIPFIMGYNNKGSAHAFPLPVNQTIKRVFLKLTYEKTNLYI